MKRHRFSSSVCAAVCSTALFVAPLACGDTGQDPKGKAADKGSDKGSDNAAAEGGKAGAPKGKSGDAGDKPAGSDEKPGLAAAAKRAAEVVAGPRDITPHYVKELDPLLDLIPADADTYVVIRDIGSLVEGTIGYANATTAAFDALATEIEKEDPSDAKELRDVLGKISEFNKALVTSGIDLSAGAVIAKKGEDDGVVIYGSAKADALPALLLTLGEKDGPDKCVTLASAAGYSVCAKADPAAYAPGSKAADFRRKLQASLPGVDLERANILASIKNKEGIAVPFSLETGQGMLHLAFTVPDAREDIVKYLEEGKAPGLGLIAPGQPFLWAQGSKKEIAAGTKRAPAMAHGMLKTLTGEFLAGGLGSGQGFGILTGLTDPAPASGLVALASMGLGEIPKELPDGTKIDVAVKTVRGTQAVHAKFTGGKQADFFKELGYASEVFAFAAGHHAAITFGAGEEVVDTVSSYTGTGPTKEMLKALPLPLAKSLEAGETAAAMHISYDTIQSGSTEKLFDSIAAAVPPGEFGKSDAKDIIDVFANLMAPLSSTSLWLTHLDDGPVFHLAVQGFAEVGTPEGAAALTAMSAIAGGADRKATYAALAAKYPSSPRVSSYQARAGDLGDPFAAMLVLAGVGGLMGAALFATAMSSVSPPPAVALPAKVAVPE